MFDSLNTLAPSRELALLLEEVDRATLSSAEKVALVRARNRQLSHLQAELYADAKAVADAVAQVEPSIGYEYAADEIAAALTWTRRAA